MMSFETNQKQINKLDDRVTRIAKAINGGLYEEGLSNKIDNQKTKIDYLERNISLITERLNVLEEIVRESGLITDFTEDEVKIRQDRKQDFFGGISTKNIPYQINKVKAL